MACGLKRIIQLSGAIQYGDIRVISNQTDITKSCEYAWSYDGVCWINWTNIESYHQICKMMEERIAELQKDGSIETIDETRQPSLLGKDSFYKGKISRETINSCIRTLLQYKLSVSLILSFC